jgi:predicted amidohydrolase YtcJ
VALPTLLLILCCGRVAPPTDPRVNLFADSVLVNGKIITVEAQDTTAEALAIRDGRILAVGSNRAIRALAGEHTEIVDLQGLTATPGLIDSHCHFANGAVNRLHSLRLSYPEVEAITDVVETVARAVDSRSAGDWIEGNGWDEGKLSERRYIYASDIDPVSPDNPVWLVHTMGHYGTANSRALELADISASTPNPPGGTIDRHPDGTPTGVLKETAMDLIARKIPSVTVEQTRRAIAELAEDFNAECMTAVKDPGIDTAIWRAYQQALLEGELSVRVFVLWRAGPSLEDARHLAERVGSFTMPYVSTGDDHLISGGIKIMLDGSGGARTAWLYEDWNRDFDERDVGNRGYPVIDPEVFREQVLLFHDAGLHVGVHAIGDRAIDWTLDTYAEALESTPTHGLRHSVIHANLPTERALDLMVQLQRVHDAGYPEPSPGFMWWIGDTYAGNFGSERSRRLIPLRSFLERGIRWGGSSDFYVTPFAARYGIWASMQRETLLGVYGANPYGKVESVDIRTALRSYTAWNARQLFLEDEIGSLEPGKYADIAIWDRDLYTVTAREIETLSCQMTFLQGEVVYRAPDATIRTDSAR